MKKILICLLTAALLAGVLAGCKDEPQNVTTTAAPTTAPTGTTAAQTTEPESTTEESTTEAESTSETTSETTAAAADFTKGCWYLFDEENRCVYALSFGKKGTGELAFFDTYNIDYSDPDYYEGDFDYTLKGDTLTVSGLPQGAPADELTLTVDGDGLACDGKALLHQNTIRLDTAVDHFN